MEFSSCIQSVTKITVRVSQKKASNLLWKSIFKKNQSPTEPQDCRGSVGGWIFEKYWFSKEIWRFFWDTRPVIFVTLCRIHIPVRPWDCGQWLKWLKVTKYSSIKWLSHNKMDKMAWKGYLYKTWNHYRMPTYLPNFFI